jgi:hypothetical protein
MEIQKALRQTTMHRSAVEGGQQQESDKLLFVDGSVAVVLDSQSRWYS